MKTDEAKHAKMAEEAGARELPPPVRRAMALTANIMKSLAYRI
jgi:ubiquinone biosynthesis monooxygenase Coq7